MYTEWLLIDSERDRIRFCRARNQRDAIVEAISHDVIPRKTDDVRPRIANPESDNKVMSPEEFQDFIDELSR